MRSVEAENGIRETSRTYCGKINSATFTMKGRELEVGMRNALRELEMIPVSGEPLNSMNFPTCPSRYLGLESNDDSQARKWSGRWEVRQY